LDQTTLLRFQEVVALFVFFLVRFIFEAEDGELSLHSGPDVLGKSVTMTLIGDEDGEAGSPDVGC